MWFGGLRMLARSFLYVPGDRPDRLDKAVDRAGDALIADLEDAVVPAAKDAARDNVCALLADGARRRPQVWVRVNVGARGADDLAAVAALPGLTGVVLPKADLPSVQQAAAALPAGVRLGALIETAQGLLDAPPLARVTGVSHLGIGEADLTAELRIEPSADERELWPLRLSLVVASSAAALAAPTGPVPLDVRDIDALLRSTQALRRAGFGARSVIHPNQVAVVEDVFTPDEQEVAAARAVVAAHERSVAEGTGVVVDERGRMVDEAVVRAARRTVQTADSLG